MAVVWFTGLPGSGKTTLAMEIQRRLERLGRPVEVLDGDELRAITRHTGFSHQDRDTQIRRVGDTAVRLERHGVTSLVALVSPIREARDAVRERCRRFIEVYLSTPLAVCEERDPKGMYRRARDGSLPSFTGVGDGYETPGSPELTIDTSQVTVDQAADLIMAELDKTPQGIA